ncbi:hypothetical protein QL285_034627 [Trifolium repens]|nr:hypothetical protein QL285_034627 [Trifolium repens]
MHPDKAPGPDGFNPAFYQHFWELCGDDIFEAAKEWLDRGYFPSSLNETNICLIPKCENPTYMKDLRPISLCNVLYKMISKLLANRLRGCLDKCVSEEQSAFIEGRSILDNALIAIEIIHALKRKTRGMSTLAETNHLMSILKIYEEASGQEINLTKSEVFFSRNLRIAAQEDLSRIMGVRHVLGTGNYIGLPSMIGRKKKDVFAFVKDRIWKRINSWRGRALSRAGKEVMIKSVLQAIPSYVMSVYLSPDSTIKDIEKMMNSYWWGGGANNKGIRWLAWDRLTHPKSQGGMGFRELHNFNLAMIAKQGWNIMTKPHTLVARIYKARWSIGNGTSIKVMGEPWLRDKGGAWLPSPKSQGVHSLTINDLMLPNMKLWDKMKIESLFPLTVVNLILETPLLDMIEDDMLEYFLIYCGLQSIVKFWF